MICGVLLLKIGAKHGSHLRLDQFRINKEFSVESTVLKLSDPAPVVDANVGARCRLSEGLDLACVSIF